MRKAMIFSAAMLIFLSIAAISADQIPVAISPGSDTGIAAVGQACPTLISQQGRLLIL